jgi:hypothetical protein
VLQVGKRNRPVVCERRSQSGENTGKDHGSIS